LSENKTKQIKRKDAKTQRQATGCCKQRQRRKVTGYGGSQAAGYEG